MSIEKPIFKDTSLYYVKYIEEVTFESLIEGLQYQIKHIKEILDSLDPNMLTFSFEVNKWNIAQLLKHIVQAERIYAYRAFRFLYGDKTDLKSFDQDSYVEFDIEPYDLIDDFLEEFVAVRENTISLFAKTSLNNLDFEGNANGMLMTPRILGWLSIGHAQHHINVLTSKYKAAFI